MKNVIEIKDLRKRFGAGENEALIFDGADLTIEKSSSFKLSYVFQFYNLVANLTVEENILLPIELLGRKIGDYMGKVNDLLELTGLKAKRNHYPSQLSGGQQQRCSIARAVLTEPEILLADEATGNLYKASGEEIMDLFKRLDQEKELTILQVTHSAECAAYGNRIVKLVEES